MGMKPIVEIMWGDFMLVALDQIVNQAATFAISRAAGRVRRLLFGRNRARRPVRVPSIPNASKRSLPIFLDCGSRFLQRHKMLTVYCAPPQLLPIRA